MSLRTRLVLALLAMALLPTLVFTLYTRYQIGVASQWWMLPGIEHALDSSLDVSRELVEHMDAEVASQAEQWARAVASPAPDLAHLVPQELSEAGLDVLQIYHRSSHTWRLETQYRRAGATDRWRPELASELDSALAAGGMIHSARGALGAAVRTRDGRLVVVALRVAPEFFDQLARIGHGAEYYRGHAVVADIQRQYAWMLVTVLVLALIVAAALLATALARQMSRPLAELAEALGRIASGDWSARVQPGGAREMRRLGEAFNGMATRLEDALAALRRAEREAAWREVAQRLAHEFKNILTPMSLSLHLMARDAARSGDDAEARAALERGVAHLGRLAEQFSQYARLPEPRFEPLDLGALARAVAAGGGGTVRVEADALVPVAGDSLLLSRAIHNLVLNAEEASAPNAFAAAGTPASGPGEPGTADGAVEIRVARERDRAVLEVLDRGAGIPAELSSRVFEPYVSTKHRGSGLGLALVRDIAVQHGGTVKLEPREGGGTRARLELPLAGAPVSDADHQGGE